MDWVGLGGRWDGLGGVEWKVEWGGWGGVVR